MTAPGNTLDKLSFLIGTWKTTGQTIGLDGSLPFKILGTDTYAWALDCQFILHTAEVLMGEEKVEVAEYIGTEGPETFFLHAFDNEGKVSMMMATFNHEGHLVMQGEGMRALLRHKKEDNHMSALWERSEDGVSWTPWMTMNFIKV